MKKEKIRVGIIGMGNCAKSLVEGVQYYSDKKKSSEGVMKFNIGGYEPKDIEFVMGFDIDERKIGQPFSVALKQKPNCAIDLVDKIKCDANVYLAPVLDGYATLMDNYPKENRFFVHDGWVKETMTGSKGFDKQIVALSRWDIVKNLKKNNIDVLINYLPVGSQVATEFWADICLETGISFVNCIPVFIASNPEWEKKFVKAKIPIIGDDMRSQFGASILSQMLQELAFERGHKVKCHIQRNVGGNTDFLNMEDKTRLKSKKTSKENVIRAQNDIRGISTKGSFLHAGPSEYIPYYGDNKVANFRLELEGFGGSPVILDAQLSVQDSPNSAGVVIDAIRYIKVARELGLVGSLRGPSAFTQKTPPTQMRFSDAVDECNALANREITISVKQFNKR